MGIRIVFILFFMISVVMRAEADNMVSHSVADTVADSGMPECMIRNVNNIKGDRTDVVFDLISSEPFIVYKAAWINCDTIKTPLEPFYLEANQEESDGKATAWHVVLEFPFTTYFGDNDQLEIHTDRGIIRRFTSQSGQYEHDIQLLRKNHEDYVVESERSMRNLWIITGIVLGIALIAGVVALILIRSRMAKKRTEIEELSLMIEERSERNLELKKKVNALYKSRLDTLNMLCNGYFDNSGSEKMRDVFYKDVEKQILTLRDNKSVEALEEIVNEYLDNTMLRLREQVPELTVNDLKFLAYIYAGFSPRAVCIFMNIKIKTFYNRRNLLKERILASEAPDKEYFVSRMNVQLAEIQYGD